MKNVGRKLKIVILSLLVVVAGTILTFMYIKAISAVGTLKSDIASLQARFDILTEKNVNRDRYVYELKYIDYQIEKIQNLLPPDIIQEHIILSLRRIEKATGVKLAAVKFSGIEKVSKLGSTASANTATQSDTTNGKTADKTADKTAESNTQASAKTAEPARDTLSFSDGDRIEMKVEVSFNASYENLKDMLQEIAREKNRVIINGINITSDGKVTEILSGSVSLTFCSLKDSKRTMGAWELQLEKGVADLFKPFEGYVQEKPSVILPPVDKSYATEPATNDFYLIASPFNEEKPAVLIGKYESVNSEIYYDGNSTIDLNFYVEEKNGQLYFRTRTQRMPYPDEKNSVMFFPKQSDVTMSIVAAPIKGDNDKVRVRLNVYNTTDKRVAIFMDDTSERVSVVVKEGRVITQ